MECRIPFGKIEKSFLAIIVKPDYCAIPFWGGWIASSNKLLNSIGYWAKDWCVKLAM